VFPYVFNEGTLARLRHLEPAVASRSRRRNDRRLFFSEPSLLLPPFHSRSEFESGQSQLREHSFKLDQFHSSGSYVGMGHGNLTEPKPGGVGCGAPKGGGGLIAKWTFRVSCHFSYRPAAESVNEHRPLSQCNTAQRNLRRGGSKLSLRVHHCSGSQVGEHVSKWTEVVSATGTLTVCGIQDATQLQRKPRLHDAPQPKGGAFVRAYWR